MLCLLLSVFLAAMPFQRSQAQYQELVELALDIEKLAQFKAILKDMYNGYEILVKGYNTVKDLSQGSFSLHKVFLDGLLSVSPVVKQYGRIADIIRAEKYILSAYTSAMGQFKASGLFNPAELDYLQSVYANLFNGSLKNLDALLMVMTDNELRMSDAERISAIDDINKDIQEKTSFLKAFTNRTNLLSAQRRRSVQETNTLKLLYAPQP